MSDLLPGYLTLPRQDEQDYDAYIAKRTQKPLRANQMSFWQNYPKFHVSLMKSWWGDAATADNNWCFDYLPKLDKPYDMLQAYELMNEGKIHGYICQGFNPLASAPNKGKLISAFSKLKFMVSMDPLETETIAFWQNHGALNDVDPSTIQTEVFRLPTTSFAEENGAVVNSSRWLQWHWKGANPPGEARSDIEIMSELFHRIKAMYEKDGGAWWEPVRDLPGTMPTRAADAGRAGDGIQRQGAGRRVRSEGPDQAGAQGRRAAGRFGDLRDDGSTRPAAGSTSVPGPDRQQMAA
jgi:formate dehydrogenase major subunit